MISKDYVEATLNANMKLAEDMAQMSGELKAEGARACPITDARIKLFGARVTHANGAIRAGAQLNC